MRIALLFLVLCLLPTPSVAQTVGQPLAADPCAAQVDPDDVEIRRMKRWFSLNAPVEAEPIAKALEISVSQRPTQYGPRISGNSQRPLITIPTGFVKLHCRVVVATWLNNEAKDGQIAFALTSQFDKCEARGDVLPICLAKALDSAWPLVLAELGKEPQKIPFVNGVAQSAFDAILLHEFGHAALGHLDPANREAVQVREGKADLFAATQMAVIGSGSFYHSYNFQLLAGLADGVSATHLTPSCSYSNAFYIAQMTHFAAHAITSFPNFNGLEQRYLAARRKILRDFAEGTPASAHLFKAVQPPCDPAVVGVVEPFRDDLLALAKFQNARVDNPPLASDGAGIAAMLKQLRTLPMKTPEGKTIRDGVFSLYVKDYSLRSDRNAEISIAITDFLLAKDYTQTVSKDFGRLLGILGIDFFHNLPKERSAGEDNLLIHQTLGSATRYNPDFSEAWAVHAMLYLREGDCVNALPAMRSAVATLNSNAEGSATYAAVLRRLEDDVRQGTCTWSQKPG